MTATATSAARIAVLISGRGSNLQALVKATQTADCGGRVALVLSNNASAAGLELARDQGIATATVEHGAFSSRERFDQAIDTVLLENNIEWVLLAGFMRILGTRFVHRWEGHLINIHPSLLPLYPGLDTHARALAAGDSVAGASVHFVTPQLDGGPVIIQGKVDVQAQDSAASLAARVLEVEHIIYPIALQWLLSGRASLRENLYHLDGSNPSQPPVWYQGQLHEPSKQ